MKKAKYIWISFALAVLYLSFSIIYFLNGWFSPLSKSPFRKALDELLCLPALIVYASGFFADDSSALVAMLFVFLVIWVLVYCVVIAIQALRRKI